MKERDNPCRHLRVERGKSGLSSKFISILATAVGRDEEYTRKLFDL
jgi:hypothetical protein